jgi:hypothetical protein
MTRQSLGHPPAGSGGVENEKRNVLHPSHAHSVRMVLLPDVQELYILTPWMRGKSSGC